MNQLSKEADVDRGTIAKIEKNQGVTDVSASKVFDALKKYHPTIIKTKEIVEK